MKYRIEISEEQLCVIGLAVDEYMRVRMGQFDALAEGLFTAALGRGLLELPKLALP